MVVTLIVLLLASVLVPSLIVLAMGFVAFLRADDYDLAKQRRESGLCGRCGYDLRASRGTCSECGTPIPVPTPSGPTGPLNV